MIVVTALLVRIVIAYIKLHIRILIFLIKHFDITNSLLTSIAVWMLTDQIEMPIGLRIGMLVGIAVISFLLQHFLKPARILFAIVGSFMCGAVAFAFFKDNESFSAYIPMAITMVIAGIVNFIGWWWKDDEAFYPTEDVL